MATTREMLDDAVKQHQAGHLQQAEQVYRQILHAEPEQPDALYFLGVIAHQVGDNRASLDYLGRAISARPDSAAAHCMMATVQMAVGQLEEATASCQQALLLRPDYAQAHHNLGIAMQTQGRLGEAVASYRQALILKPDSPETLNNLGSAFQAVERFDEATEHYRQALKLNPQYCEAHNNLGNVLKKQDRPEQAAAAYRRALEIRPEFAEVHVNLGMTLQDQGKLDEAVAAFRRAVEIKPEYAEAHNNLGNALTEQGRLEEAIAAFHRALQLRANYAEALNNLGNALRAQGRPDQAEISFNRALQARPDFVEALCNLGSMLQDLGRGEEAVDSFNRALKAQPDSVDVLNRLGMTFEDQAEPQQALEMYRRLVKLEPHQPLWQLRVATAACPDVVQSVEEIDRYRGELAAELDRISAKDLSIPVAGLSVRGSYPPFRLMYQGRDDRPIKEAYARVFRRGLPEHTPVAKSAGNRIGFVVTHRHEGVFLDFMRGILEHVTPGLFEISVVCSPAGAAVVRGRIENQSIDVVALPPRFDQAVEAIRRAGFDVLHYWEIGTDTINYFLPLLRPAAVQCTSWGLPATSGMEEIDHYISSELLETEAADEHYTEKLLRLSTLPAYYYRHAPPQELMDPEHFGLAGDRHLYLCPQRLLKFHPDFDPLLADILRHDPLAEIVLIAGVQPRLRELLTGRFQAAMPDCAGRIRFLPQQTRTEMLNLMKLADVMLDPLHFGGGNTTYEALGLGLPIVTLPSAYMRGRVTCGCYRKMGIPECVADDARDYVQKAVRLGTDADYRAGVAEQIRNAAETLFEDLQAVREYERILQQMLQHGPDRSDAGR